MLQLKKRPIKKTKLVYSCIDVKNGSSHAWKTKQKRKEENEKEYLSKKYRRSFWKLKNPQSYISKLTIALVKDESTN